MSNHVSILPTMTLVYADQPNAEIAISERMPDRTIIQVRMLGGAAEEVTLGALRAWIVGRSTADTHCTCGAPLPCGWCVPPTQRSPHA